MKWLIEFHPHNPIHLKEKKKRQTDPLCTISPELPFSSVFLSTKELGFHPNVGEIHIGIVPGEELLQLQRLFSWLPIWTLLLKFQLLFDELALLFLCHLEVRRHILRHLRGYIPHSMEVRSRLFLNAAEVPFDVSAEVPFAFDDFIAGAAEGATELAVASFTFRLR